MNKLAALAVKSAANAHVPYSGRQTAAVLLLSDGSWVPGVRVESASYSLVIPALLNACTTSVAAGRLDFEAVAMNRPVSEAEIAFLKGAVSSPVLVLQPGGIVFSDSRRLPEPAAKPLDPRVQETADGIHLARAAAGNARVASSGFPVGCLLDCSNGWRIPGCNVEHPDWTRVLCAERNALGTAVTYGALPVHRVFLSCLNDPGGTPCGACRQLLFELAPAAEIVMDRGDGPPASSTPQELLPSAFSGSAKLMNRTSLEGI